MEVLKENLQGSLVDVFVQKMIVNIEVNLSFIVMIMVLGLREVFEKHFITILWLKK